MPSSAYFEQLEQNIVLLLSEKKFKQAYELCNQVILKYPDETDFINLKEKIEQAVKDENEKTAEEKIDELKDLWKRKKYAEILKRLKELLKIAPNNKKVLREIKEAQEGYKEQIAELQKEFIKKQNDLLNKLLMENPDLLINELYELEKSNPQNIQVEEMLRKFRDKLIEKKIKEKRDLINSDKFEAISHFIDQLTKIDQKNPRITQLVQNVRLKQHQYQIEQKKEFIYRGEKEIVTLIQLEKFDKAIKAAEEILKIDATNKRIQNLLKSAEKKFFNQTQNGAIASILANLPDLESQYKKNKSKFLKL